MSSRPRPPSAKAENTNPSAKAERMNTSNPPASGNPAAPRHILAMDGGGVMSLLTLTLLKRLEADMPGFLKAVDLFAGTSAGGINALLLAAQADPAEALDACCSLWDGRIDIWDTDVLRLAKAGLGRRATYDNAALATALTGLFGEDTLGDLKHGACVTAFDVAGRDTGGWSPVMFTNVGPGGYFGEVQRCVTAALATSALPMTLPIAGGYVDGGLYAYNPSLAVLTEAIMCARADDTSALDLQAQNVDHTFEVASESRAPGLQDAVPAGFLADVRLLSLGTGGNPSRLAVLDADWGWQQWMTDPKYPARLTQVAAAAAEQSTNLTCQQLLGNRGFHRVQPALADHIHRSKDYGALGHPPVLAGLRATAVAVAEAHDLTPTLTWLDAGGWDR